MRRRITEGGRGGRKGEKGRGRGNKKFSCFFGGVGMGNCTDEVTILVLGRGGEGEMKLEIEK